jgi:DNA-directed RNA polymerase specialized sigma24 family protein
VSYLFPQIRAKGGENVDIVKIIYEGQEIEVAKPVADFLEDEERKREQNEGKSDSRHLTDKPVDFAEDVAAMDVLNKLSATEKSIALDRINGLTIREIAQKQGVYPNAITKRLKTIRKKLSR